MIYKAKYILFSIEVKQNFRLIHPSIAKGLWDKDKRSSLCSSGLK
jgi:hypothetical protein